MMAYLSKASLFGIFIFAALSLSGCVSGNVVVENATSPCLNASKYLVKDSQQIIGPVGLSLPEDYTIKAPLAKDDKLYASLPITLLYHGDTGVSLNSSSTTAGTQLRFSHLSAAPDWADSDPVASAVLRGKSSKTNETTLAGYVVANQPGCYQLNITLSNVTYGPFALIIKQDGENAAVPLSNP